MDFYVGQNVLGRIKNLKGSCHAEHKVGDEFELIIYSSGGLYGFFYHGVFPLLIML